MQRFASPRTIEQRRQLEQRADPFARWQRQPAQPEAQAGDERLRGGRQLRRVAHSVEHRDRERVEREPLLRNALANVLAKLAQVRLDERQGGEIGDAVDAVATDKIGGGTGAKQPTPHRQRPPVGADGPGGVGELTESERVPEPALQQTLEKQRFERRRHRRAGLRLQGEREQLGQRMGGESMRSRTIRAVERQPANSRAPHEAPLPQRRRGRSGRRTRRVGIVGERHARTLASSLPPPPSLTSPQGSPVRWIGSID